MMGHASRDIPGIGLHGALPPEVQSLCPRMREIATIVYLNGPATTRDVQARISDPLTVYGIRTMLNRLVRKGVVTRRRSGCHDCLAPKEQAAVGRHHHSLADGNRHGRGHELLLYIDRERSRR